MNYQTPKIYFSLVFLLLSLCTGFAQFSLDRFTITHNNRDYEAAEIISEYIQFKSISGNEMDAGAWLKGICEENGLYVKQMGDTNGNYNFSASIYPLSDNKPNVVFLTHIDVVPANEFSKWIFPPFSGKITENEIWGRGAFDNKGPAIIQLFSIIDFKKKNENKQLPYNFTFLAVSAEETQSEGGVKFVVDNYFEDLNPVVVLGEGPPALTNILHKNPEKPVFAISLAHKSILWIKLDLKIETSGHGSVTPHQYVAQEMTKSLNNIIEKKTRAVYNSYNIKILKELGGIEEGLFSFVLKHPGLFRCLITPQLRKKPEVFALFSNTITITGINSYNEVVNSIPDEISVMLDCRLLPMESKEEFIYKLRKDLNNENIKITVLKEMPNMNPSTTDNEFYGHIKNAILDNFPNVEIVSAMVPNYNDTGIFRSKNVPAYSFFPFIMDMKYLESIHNVNEKFPKSSIYQGIESYISFMENCIK